MDKENLREQVKSQFKYYLFNVARSARRTSEGFNLGKTAVDSFMSFLEANRLFDYNPEKWSHIESMYDITNPEKVKQIADDLLNDKAFIKHDNEKNQGWRSGAISHYVCFINARSFFRREKNEANLSNNIIKQPLQQIFYGAPGTGKSHKIKDDTDVKAADEKNLVFRTTFHPDSDYSTFVGAYKPTTTKRAVRNVAGDIVRDTEKKEVYEDCITYSFIPQAFLQAYVAAWNNPDDKVFLVIEEINRGNCAQIFGDLFQLLDRDDDGASEYPTMADKDISKYLNGNDEEGRPVLTNKDGIKDDKLRLPKNLHIWATMNTSDQSLFPIDSAFKRRWDWVYMPIDTEKDKWFVDVNGNHYSWTKFLNTINDDILTDETAEDKHLGFYFCKATKKRESSDAEPNVITTETFVGKVLFYLWNDVFKVYGIPSSIGSGKDWGYRKFYRPDGSVDKEKVAELMQKLKIKSEEEEQTDNEEQ